MDAGIPHLVAERRNRIGVSRLYRRPDGSWFVTLENRTYSQHFEIPAHKVEDWKRAFGLV